MKAQRLIVIGYRLRAKFPSLNVDQDYSADQRSTFLSTLSTTKNSLVLCHSSEPVAVSLLEGAGADADASDFRRFAFLCFSADRCARRFNSPFVHFLSYRVPSRDEAALVRFSAMIDRWREFSTMPEDSHISALWQIVDPPEEASRVAQLRELEIVLMDGADRYERHRDIVSRYFSPPLSFAKLREYFLEECGKVDLKKN